MISRQSQAQSYCNADINFIIEKIRDSYAGYHDKQGDQVIKNQLNDLSKKEYEHADCFTKLARILLQFQDLHLRLRTCKPVTPTNTAQLKSQLKNVEVYLSQNNKSKDKYEGYWMSDTHDYVVAIKKTKALPVEYTAYIIETKNTRLPPGNEKFVLTQLDSIVFQTAIISATGFKVATLSRFANENTLLTGVSGKWLKLPGYSRDMLKSYKSFDWQPSLAVIDSETVLIRIPTSDYAAKERVDSLVEANEKLIGRSKKLIVDVRNNTGGTTLTYSSLFPYIYTKPIITLGGTVRCSQDVIEQEQQYLDKNRLTLPAGELAYTQKMLKGMIANKGGYFQEVQDTLKYDSISVYPKQVGVIMNYASASAAELFVQYCRQSTKVTIFGEDTWGAIDYMENIVLKTPSQQFEVFIPRMKTAFRNSSLPHANDGLKPDVEISQSEPDWIDFVKKYYDKITKLTDRNI